MILNFMDFLDLNELDRSGAEKIAKAYCYRLKNPQKYPELEGLQGFDLIAKNESLPKKKKIHFTRNRQRSYPKNVYLHGLG